MRLHPDRGNVQLLQPERGGLIWFVGGVQSSAVESTSYLCSINSQQATAGAPHMKASICINFGPLAKRKL
jgi:hypothetical protein